MVEFVKEELPKCLDYKLINNTFNINVLYNYLNFQAIIPKESFWLKYTNPILMRFIIENI